MTVRPKTEYVFIQYTDNRRSPHETRYESLVLVHPDGTVRYAYGKLSQYIGKPLHLIPVNKTQALISLSTP